MVEVEYSRDVPKEIFRVVDPSVAKHLDILPSWMSHLFVTFDPSLDKSCTFTTIEDARRGKLCIGGHFLEWSDHRREQVIIHEFCHAYTTVVSAVAKEAIEDLGEENKPARLIAMRAVTEACERATEDLAQCFVRLRVAPDKLVPPENT